jgi:hypothetical protein
MNLNDTATRNVRYDPDACADTLIEKSITWRTHTSIRNRSRSRRSGSGRGRGRESSRLLNTILKNKPGGRRYKIILDFPLRLPESKESKNESTVSTPTSAQESNSQFRFRFWFLPTPNRGERVVKGIDTFDFDSELWLLPRLRLWFLMF